MGSYYLLLVVIFAYWWFDRQFLKPKPMKPKSRKSSYITTKQIYKNRIIRFKKNNFAVFKRKVKVVLFYLKKEVSAVFSYFL